MKKLQIDLFTEVMNASSETDFEQLRSIAKGEGYTLFRRFLSKIKDQLKQFDDAQAEPILSIISKAKQVFPDPGSISPSWEHIWPHLEQIASYKNEVLRTVPLSERSGEWQVLLDNPHTNQSIVCYPALSFLEAAYLYGYFRSDLNDNEYIRLQKIENVIMHYGK